MKTPITYYGGKQNMLSIILPMIPKHTTYVEPFAGGASLFFAKDPSPVEVINDINGNVANFYRVCKHNFEPLFSMIDDTLYDEYTYNYCREIYRARVPADELNRAWAFWVGVNMSFGASVFDGSFRIITNSNKISHPAKRMRNKIELLKDINNRLENTMILSKDALDIIEKYDNKKTFIYCDPPYIGANQGHYKGYKLEQFQELLQLCMYSKSKILISCYWHDTINDFDFIIEKKEMRLGVLNGGKKTEILLRNYQNESVSEFYQSSLF